LLKNSHLAAILETPFCGCDDLTVFEQPELFNKLPKKLFYGMNYA